MTELFARGTVVLDGGLSNALEDRGHDLSSALWTARLLRDDPGEVVAVHRAYFAAGAHGWHATRPRRTPMSPSSWPPRSGRTAPPVPTVRSTRAATAVRQRSCAT